MNRGITETPEELLVRARGCTLCARHLPLGPRPLFQLHPDARILVAGQAPGRLAHESGIPFDDPSGDRLREWLGLDREAFYDPHLVAILPVGLCYPGKSGSGDLPPRSECAPAWRKPLLGLLPRIEMTLVLGNHAQRHHFGPPHRSLTDRVRDWRTRWPQLIPMPHPSPRNLAWMKRNPWFESEVIPRVRRRIASLRSCLL